VYEGTFERRPGDALEPDGMRRSADEIGCTSTTHTRRTTRPRAGQTGSSV